MKSLNFTDLWGHILNCKHEAEVPQINQVVFDLIGAHEKRVILWHEFKGSHWHEGYHEHDADQAHTCTYLGSKSALLFKSELNALSKKIQWLQTFAAICGIIYQLWRFHNK